jgi:hypothetical protein
MSAGWILLLVISALGLIGLWGLRGIVATVRHWQGTFGPARTLRENVEWFILPCVLATGILFANTDWLMQLRFQLSEPSLRAIAEDPHGEARPSRAGLFFVHHAYSEDVRAHLTTNHPADAVRSGFLYSPREPPVDAHAWEYTHLSGPWWTFVFRD